MVDYEGHDHASPKLRAAVFSRESKGKGTSIADQDRENQEAADTLGAEVLHTLSDRVGASRFSKRDRVGWPEVTELVRSGAIDLLIVWEVSRADRTMDTWTPFVSACRDRGVKLYITSLETLYDPGKAAHRKALLDMGSSAEYETGQLSERSRKGVRGAVLDGKQHGHSAFGFTREYGPIVDGKRTFTEVPNEDIDVAIWIIEQVAAGTPGIRIRTELNSRPPEKRGNRFWGDKSIKYIARNPAYVGMRRHHGKLSPGNWGAVIDEATFWRAQRALDDPARKRSGPGTRANNLLSYIMTCSQCTEPDGRPSVVTMRRGRWQPRYRCNSPKGCTTIDVATADEYVTRVVCARLSRDDAREAFVQGGQELAAAEAEVARLERKLEEARQAYDDDVISAEALGRKEKRLMPQIEEAEQRARSLRAGDALADLVADNPDEVRAHWEALPLIRQRAVLKTLFARLVLAPTTVRLTRYATEDERLKVASERITGEWA